MIELKSVRKIFNTDGVPFEALRDIGLTINKSEFSAIIGPSGSGKSTLLSIIGGIARPTSGTVFVEGIPIHNLTVEQLSDFRRKYIGFVFQQFHLIPFLTAIENVMLPLSITDKKDSEQKGLAMACLENVGLKNKSQSLPSQLSGGEQQRVAIARAIINEPPIIIADEPTGNLDSSTGEDIINVLIELNRKGHTVIIVTHDEKIASVTRRIISLKDGILSFE
jgi:putative ABC transport system ATP-binding protein